MPRSSEAVATEAAFKRLLAVSRPTWIGDFELWKVTDRKHRFLEEHELTNCFRRSQEVRMPPETAPEGAFPLPRFHHGENFVPLIGFEWDFRPGKTDGRGSLKLYLVPFPATRSALKKIQRRYLILRYEDADAGPQWGFSHVQSCEKDIFYPQWQGLEDRVVSNEIPRIPLMGHRLDAPSLLLTVVTSLYGVGSVAFNAFNHEDITGNSPMAKELLHAFQSPRS